MDVPEIFSDLLETRVLLTPCITLTKSRETLLFRSHCEIAKRDNKLHRICRSVSPNRTTRLPQGGFFMKCYYEYFSKICRENSSCVKIWHEWWVRYVRHTERKFMIISRSFLLIMGTVSHKSWIENQKHILYSISFFAKIVPFKR